MVENDNDKNTNHNDNYSDNVFFFVIDNDDDNNNNNDNNNCWDLLLTVRSMVDFLLKSSRLRLISLY